MNKSKLVNCIKGKGFTLKGFSTEIGMNASTLYRKISGDSDFSRKEIISIASILKLTDSEKNDIFFAE